MAEKDRPVQLWVPMSTADNERVLQHCRDAMRDHHDHDNARADMLRDV